MGGAGKITDDVRCPCLSGESYGACCAPFHAGRAAAPTAERLMRSRYSAFALGLADYLLATWHPSTRPRAVELDADDRWFLLDIVRTERGGMLDDEGIVEFRACFRSASDPGEAHEAHEVHETSRFVRVERRWMYLDAV